MNFDLNKLISKYKYDPNSVKKNYDGKTDVYLAKVSYRYDYLKRILVLLLILVIIAFVLSGNISYSKFYYLTKDIALSSDYVNSVHDTVSYNVGNSQAFAPYLSGIAVASREKLSIFSAGGRELFSTSHDYGNPAIEVSDKYVLLYDVGGKQLALYNSFSKADEKLLDYPIYDACISSEGTYALVTKSEKYDSVVKVVQQSGREYVYNYSDGRVCSASLSENGLQLAVILVFSDTDEIRSELRLYRLGKSDYSKKDLTFSGIPYEVKILEAGNILAVGAHGVNAFGSGLSSLGEYFSEEEIYAYSFGNDNIAVAHSSKDGTKSEVVVLNKRGKLENSFDYVERVIDLALCKGYLFTQRLGGFERTHIALGVTERVEMIATDFKMIVTDKNTLVVCNDSYAKFLSFR